MSTKRGANVRGFIMFEDVASLSTVTDFVKKVGKNLVLVTSVKGKKGQLLWKDNASFLLANDAY